MKILCVISARGGSKGLKNKNVKLINGKPLIAWSILQARKSNLFKNIFVSTDSRHISRIAKRYGAFVLPLRKKNLSNDIVSKFLVWKDALKSIEKIKKEKFDLYLDLDCTNPIRSKADIYGIIEIIKKNKFVDGAITISKSRKNPYFNMVEKKKNILRLVKKPKKPVNSRQAAPKIYDIVANMYCLKTSYLKKSKNLLNGKILGYEVNQESSFDIDTKLDFEIIEMILKKNENKK